MADSTVEFGKADEPGNKNQRSSIAFPYLDLDTAVEVARAVYARGGRTGCETDELAAEMNQVVSGAFRLKTGTARTFDLIEKAGSGGGVKLTELGLQVIGETTEKAARAEAFLRVPLYAAIFEQYKGHLLPPRRALEREMEKLGVSTKQSDKARQAFERSARQAGFFERGEDRLVRPRADLPTKRLDEPDEELEPQSKRPPAGGGGGDGGGGKDPPKGSDLPTLLLELLDPTAMTDEEQQAVWTLLLYVKRPKASKPKPTPEQLLE
jgi:hypothetical protein